MWRAAVGSFPSAASCSPRPRTFKVRRWSPCARTRPWGRLAEEAERLYQAAEVLTADPGLVAFNRAHRPLSGQSRSGQPSSRSEAQALLGTQRCGVSAGRAAKAWFNPRHVSCDNPVPPCGVSLAIACLERCLDSKVADAPCGPTRARTTSSSPSCCGTRPARKTTRRQPQPRSPAGGSPQRTATGRPQGFDNQPGNPEMGEGNTGENAEGRFDADHDRGHEGGARQRPDPRAGPTGPTSPSRIFATSAPSLPKRRETDSA